VACGGVLFVLLFLAQRGEAIKEQLAEIGQGDGVAAGDAFAGELFDEIAEEEIHGIGGGEVFDLAEKLGGEGFGIEGGTLRFETVYVVGAESRALLSIRRAVMLVNQHVATLAARILVLAVRFGVMFGGHGESLSTWWSGVESRQLKVESLEKEQPPSPPMFLKRYDSKRVSGEGSVNDMTIKELREVKEVVEVKEEEKDNAEAQRTRRRRRGADCCVERRVWRLTFKTHINIDVIGLSRCTYMSFERLVEKNSKQIEWKRKLFVP
jgi:hypothetical protein